MRRVRRKSEKRTKKALGPSLGIVPLDLLTYAEMASSLEVDF